MDTGEGEGLQVIGGADDFGLLIAAGAAADELEIVVEEELARRSRGIGRRGWRGLGARCGIGAWRGEVDGADDVDVVEEEGFVEISWIFEEEPGGFFEAAAGVEEDFFAGDFDAQAEVFVGFQVVDDLVGEVVDVDDEFGDAESAEAGEGDFEEGAAGEFDKGFGAGVGEGLRRVPRPAARIMAFIEAISACLVSRVQGGARLLRVRCGCGGVWLIARRDKRSGAGRRCSRRRPLNF